MITEYHELPEFVKGAIYANAKTSCPDCGLRGVPQSWAVATYNAMLIKLMTEDEVVTGLVEIEEATSND